MGLLSRAQALPQGQQMTQPMGQGDPMESIKEMLRQSGYPVDQMPPQQLQALVMQVIQQQQQGQPR